MEASITFRNLIHAIDRTVLNLKKVKKEKEAVPTELKKQILDILTFIQDSNKPSFTTVLFDKSIFIEKEPLEKLHENLVGIRIEQKEIDHAINIVKKKNLTNNEEIIAIQSILMKISLPIWETLNS